MSKDATTATAAPAISVRDLRVTFSGGGKTIQAVNGVSLDVAPGEAVALIGESGSGKSVTLRALMRLHPPRRTTMLGDIRVDGQDVLKLDKRALARLRGGTVAMVFQEPLLALDPVYTVGQQIVECIRTHRKLSRQEAQALALKALESVRIPSPERRLAAYPHEMSGGMRQRAMIALALSARQRHRGPDWSGVHAEPRALLVHERLAIVDPEGGAQPLKSADGALVLAVNGEIYHHRALRTEWHEIGR
ncbi:MAG: ATP-binding cassette domain-containing protein, partial [Cupriavidus sp.]|nr:ATP-binding cassette domain-containing protein [Cupriavidus sp.]